MVIFTRFSDIYQFNEVSCKAASYFHLSVQFLFEVKTKAALMEKSISAK